MSRGLRVLIINKHPKDVLGGSEMQADIIASGLHARGHSVTYGAVNGSAISYDTQYDVKHLGRPFGSRLREVVRDVVPDVIYWRHNHRYFITALLLAKRFSIPFVFGVSALSDVRRRRQSERLTVRSLGRILRDATSHYALRFVDGATSLNQDYLDLVPVRSRVHLPNAVSDETVPFTWNRPFVIWVANIKASKQPEAFVALANQWKLPGLDFLMVGRIADPRYRKLLEPPQAPANFHYLGPRSPAEVNGMLRAAVCLVHTCRPEGFGNIFIQAWRAGCPTVTLHFDPEGLIERHGAGFHAHGDLGRLRQSVEAILTDPALRSTQSGQASSLGERFTPEQTVDRIEQFLTVMVRGHPEVPFA